jgi:FAD/FMN-containing dehydrogenase
MSAKVPVRKSGVILFLFWLMFAGASVQATAEPVTTPHIVNDITQLNPIKVENIVTPTSVAEISRLMADHDGPISIGGGQYSQGGQTACTDCLFLDMRHFNRILSLDAQAHRITVEPGITWRQIQEAIDPYNLSPKIMQSYSNFTVGGSISVNCHGRYVGLGPLVASVVQIRLVMANGDIKTASRTENPDLFAAAIGGYGGIGVIVEATLDLADNVRLERVHKRMAVRDYRAWYQANIAPSTTAILSSATLYPKSYRTVNAITSSLTDKPVTISERLASQKRPTRFQLGLLDFVSHKPVGKLFREQIYDRLHRGDTEVVWRNFEAAEDVNGIEPLSRQKSTYVLQEYFIPVAHFEAFVPRMAAILNAHKVNVLNVSIRHAEPDRLTLLSWAPEETYAFVIYYEQGTDAASREEVGVWTRELTEAAIDEGGRYYLPYQILATKAQFLKAYPNAPAFFAVKRRVDPTYKFRNRLWEAYYTP